VRRPVCAAIIVFTLYCPAAAAGESLLRNGDMEGLPGKEGVPSGWSLAWKATRSTDKQAASRQPPDFALDRKIFHSGRQSVRIGIGRAEDDAFLRQVVTALPAGKSVYRVRAWIKTKNVNRSDARMTVAFGGKGGKWLGADYSLIRVDADADWALHAGLFIVPAGTTDTDGVKSCAGRYKLPNGWEFTEPDRLRRILAEAIVGLAR